jgi:hypothetical protein
VSDDAKPAIAMAGFFCADLTLPLTGPSSADQEWIGLGSEGFIRRI